MGHIANNIAALKLSVAKNVTLVAVSKTKPAELVLEAYNSGHRIFGENKVQEMVQKHEVLPRDIEWHLIGHLQTNKVKYIASFVKLIHSVDSLKLLSVINDEAKKNNRVIECLLQVKIAREETKFGMEQAEVISLLQSNEYKSFKNITIKGLMGMASFIDNLNQVREEFRGLKAFFDKLKSEFFRDNFQFSEISMGMSDDYTTAIEEGSTMIRVGSKIFGERIYL